MTIQLQSLAPNGDTSKSARPLVTFVLYTDEIDPVIEFEVWLSQTPNPMTDPNAIHWTEVRTQEYSGIPNYYINMLTLPAGSGLTPGAWYVTGRVTRTSDSAVIVTQTNPFTVTYAIKVNEYSPPSGTSQVYTSGVNNFGVSWNFAQGENPLDHQTAYQVVVNKVSDNSIVVDTGKVVSTTEAASLTIPAIETDVQLSWKVRVWNAWDAVSDYSGAHTFTLAQPFSLTITDPSPDEVMSAGNPNISLTVEGGANTSVKRVDVSAWEGVTKVWSKTVSGSWADNATLNITDSASVFKPGRDYTYRAVGMNQLNAFSPESLVNFTVDFALPTAPVNAPGVNTAYYNTEGYIAVAWNTIPLDTQFYRWGVERKDDLIDVTTQAVLEEGTWKEVGAVYESAPSYEFRDYHAPSNYRVSYRYVQVAVKYATEVRSDPSNAATVFPTTDKYWMVAGVNGSESIDVTPLWNVTGDNFTDEQETNQFTLMGRGRYSERGTKLGVSGTLTTKFRDGAGMTARQKRLAFQRFKEENPVAILRNPFGDAYKVTLNNVTIDFEPGTGKTEMSNASIPYVEVVE